MFVNGLNVRLKMELHIGEVALAGSVGNAKNNKRKQCKNGFFIITR